MTTQKNTQAVTIKLLGKEAIKEQQNGIRKNILSLDAEVHSNAVQCLLHAETHGDTSLFRRLLVDVIDAKTGYRRQSLIAWMRVHSPMELKGTDINLSGTDNKGVRRPFKVTEANDNPFWTLKALNEIAIKPVYRDTLMSPINRVIKDFMAAMENTVNGKPVLADKPFYDGVHGDKVVDFFEKVKELAAQLPPDETLAVRKAQADIERNTNFVKTHAKDVNESDRAEEVAVEAMTA